MSFPLSGRSALVTGSTAGIGVAIAHRLAAAGANVVVSGRDTDRGQAVVRAIAAAGQLAHFVATDLSEGPLAVQSLADRAEAEAGGRIDVLVNNAAMLIAPSPTADVSADLIARAFAVNVAAPFLLTGILAARMVQRGDGAVINVGSINGLVGMAGSALYSATKAAVHSLTKSWAAEFAGSGVRVNTVAPGPTATARNAELAEHLAPLLAREPSGAMTTPDQVAAAVVFLAGADAANIHGATLSIDGGFAAI
jgi:NAD(P)-dependent dehydrogenase (short-subunit alcohol dehydrogenase family)